MQAKRPVAWLLGPGTIGAVLLLLVQAATQAAIQTRPSESPHAEEDPPRARGGGWLDINVLGAQGQDVRLELHKVGQPAGISAYGVLHPPFGVVLPEGGQGHGATELAEWSLESNGALGASVRLPQGEYHAGIRLFGARTSSRNIVRLASVRVVPGRREALTLDLNAARVWRVLPRPSYEGDPIDNGFLRIAGQAVHFSRDRDLARALGEDGSSDALERSARFETFGETPTEAVLYSVGVEGEAVRLRGPDTSAERLHLLGQHAHLFAVLPTADRVYARLSRAFNGRLGGHLTGSSEAPHTYRDIPVNIPREPTPVSEAGRGVSVVVRGGAATGMITEVTPEGRHVLRDWFTATPIGLHLLEGGHGRMIELVNEMGVPLIVALHPPRLPDMNLELFYASVIDAGRSCAVWVPDAVDAISWYEHGESTFAPYGPDARSQGGRALGQSSGLGTESLRLIAR